MIPDQADWTITVEDYLLARTCLRRYVESRKTSSAADDVATVSSLNARHIAEQRQNVRQLLREFFVGSEYSFGFVVEAAGCRAEIDVVRSESQNSISIFHATAAFAPKPNAIETLRFQIALAEEAGYSVTEARLVCLDKRFVRVSGVRAQELLVLKDPGKKLRRGAGRVWTTVDKIRSTRSAHEYPPPCRAPGRCPVCRGLDDERPKHHVRTLFRGAGVSDRLEDAGYNDLTEVPVDEVDGRRHKLQLQSIQSGRPYVDLEQITVFLKLLVFPRVYLDFETISRAVPPVAGVYPWEHVPIQFSAHRQMTRHSKIEHFSFVCESLSPNEDTRCEMAQALHQVLHGCESVLVYAAAFERRMLRRLGQWCASFSPVAEAVAEKIHDIQQPFAEFWYYHPEQLGRTGLKTVLPVLTGRGYEQLDVNDGLEASLRWQYEYAREVAGRTAPPLRADENERRMLRDQLEEYCAQDTQALANIVAVLESMAES